MSCDPINNHVEIMLDNLIEQYRCAEKLQSVLSITGLSVQELEDVFQCLFGRLDIANVSGNGLDLIGTIVGQPRPGGLEDEFYRILLFAKIGSNNSFGTPEQVISIYKLLTQADNVQLQEWYPAGVYIMSDGEINPITVNFLYNVIQDVVPAGVRVDYIGKWDPDCYFAFENNPTDPNNGGFGTTVDANVGGCLGFVYLITTDFAFDGNDPETFGLGTVLDPLVGGSLGTV